MRRLPDPRGGSPGCKNPGSGAWQVSVLVQDWLPDPGAPMNDEKIHQTITELVGEEHQLRTQPDHSDDQRARLRQLEESLDQCWDLLRQRAALRDAGENPDAAAARPIAEVEGYLQ